MAKKKTTVIIQGHVTIQTASSRNYTAIGSGVGDVTVNITDNVTIDTVDEAINVAPDFSGSSIGGGTVTDSRNRKVEVTIDGGDNGRIEIGKKSAITGLSGAISGTEVNIGNNVLLKMKQKEYWHDWSDSRNPYINVNGAEAAVGTRDNPGAGGLVIGDNTELWYSAYGAYGRLQKIVHGKNVCKKSPTEHIKKTPPALHRALQIILATMSIRTEQPTPVVTVLGQMSFPPWAMTGRTTVTPTISVTETM